MIVAYVSSFSVMSPFQGLIVIRDMHLSPMVETIGWEMSHRWCFFFFSKTSPFMA